MVSIQDCDKAQEEQRKKVEEEAAAAQLAASVTPGIAAAALMLEEDGADAEERTRKEAAAPAPNPLAVAAAAIASRRSSLQLEDEGAGAGTGAVSGAGSGATEVSPQPIQRPHRDSSNNFRPFQFNHEDSISLDPAKNISGDSEGVPPAPKEDVLSPGSRAKEVAKSLAKKKSFHFQQKEGSSRASPMPGTENPRSQPEQADDDDDDDDGDLGHLLASGDDALLDIGSGDSAAAALGVLPGPVSPDQLKEALARKKHSFAQYTERPDSTSPPPAAVDGFDRQETAALGSFGDLYGARQKSTFASSDPAEDEFFGPGGRGLQRCQTAEVGMSNVYPEEASSTRDLLTAGSTEEGVAALLGGTDVSIVAANSRSALGMRGRDGAGAGAAGRAQEGSVPAMTNPLARGSGKGPRLTIENPNSDPNLQRQLQQKLAGNSPILDTPTGPAVDSPVHAAAAAAAAQAVAAKRAATAAAAANAQINTTSAASAITSPESTTTSGASTAPAGADPRSNLMAALTNRSSMGMMGLSRRGISQADSMDFSVHQIDIDHLDESLGLDQGASRGGEGYDDDVGLGSISRSASGTAAAGIPPQSRSTSAPMRSGAAALFGQIGPEDGAVPRAPVAGAAGPAAAIAAAAAAAAAQQQQHQQSEAAPATPSLVTIAGPAPALIPEPVETGPPIITVAPAVTTTNPIDTEISQMKLAVKGVQYPAERLARRIKIWYCSSGFSLSTEQEIQQFVRELRNTGDAVLEAFSEEKFGSILDWANLLEVLRKYEQRRLLEEPPAAAVAEPANSSSIVFNMTANLPSRKQPSVKVQLDDSVDSNGLAAKVRMSKWIQE